MRFNEGMNVQNSMQGFSLPLEVSVNQVNKSCRLSAGDTYHIRNMVRVHLIKVLIIDVGIGKVKPTR